MKKKSIVMLATGVILAASLVIGGTLAYFTDQADVTNTMTVGNVGILLDEAKVTKEGDKWVASTERQPEGTGNEYEGVYPGAYLPKDPMVTVDANSSGSYIRMMVTINNMAAIDQTFAPNGLDLTTIFTGYDAATWVPQGNVKNSDDTRTYTFWYKEKVAGTGETAQALAPLFTGIQIPSDWNGTQLAVFNNLKIKVAAQAIQADGFVDAAEAFKNLDAELANANP